MCSCPGLNNCRRLLNEFLNVTKSFIARLIFVVYCFVAVWRVTRALNEELYWLLLITLIPLFIEVIYTVIKQTSSQLKW